MKVGKKIKTILAEMLGFESYNQIKSEYSFELDLGLDEDDYLEFLEILEDETEVAVVPYANNFKTVGDVIDFIKDAM